MAITWKYSLLSDNYANKFIRPSLYIEQYYRTKQLSGPSTLLMWEKKWPKNKAIQNKKKGGKQSKWMAKRNTIRLT